MSISLILVLVPRLAWVASFPVRGKSFSPAGFRLFAALYFPVLFYSIVERVDRIARELDNSTKQKT